MHSWREILPAIRFEAQSLKANFPTFWRAPVKTRTELDLVAEPLHLSTRRVICKTMPYPPCFRRTSQRSSKRKLDHSELRNESSHKTKAGPFEVWVWTARDVSKAVRMIQQVFPYHRTRKESLTLKFILTSCLSVNCSQVLSISQVLPVLPRGLNWSIYH